MTLHFESLRDVREFVGLATLQNYDVHIQDGDRKVNAKSFMEMFTINFTEPLPVTIDSQEHSEEFAHAAKKFLL